MTDEPKTPRITVTLSFQIDEYFDEAQFWSDGKEPHTLEGALAVIREQGGPRKMARDWDLFDGAHMDVEVHTEGGKREAATVDWDGEETSFSRKNRLPKDPP
jgi:hypothetical protein